MAMVLSQRQLVLLLSLCSFALSAPPAKFVTSTFIPAATPAIASASRATDLARQRAVATAYGLRKDAARPRHRPTPVSCDARQSGTALLAKKKKVAASKGKIQVKLLKFVQGTGKQGDVVMVAPAFYENKLRKSGSAVKITDAEVEKERAKNAAESKKKMEVALDLQEKIDGLTLDIPRRAGPEGHLFGGVGKKDILVELKKKFPKGTLEGKHIKIIRVLGPDGKDMGKHDIKEIGEFKSSVSLQTDVTADFTVAVKAE